MNLPIKHVASCDINFSYPDFFALGVANAGIMLFNSETGKIILKQRHEELNFCKFNSNGKQIASKIENRSISVLDSIRGHTIKLLEYQDSEKSSNLSTLGFEEDLLLSVRDSSLHILDTTSAKAVVKLRSDSKIENTSFSLHPEGRLITTKKTQDTISFEGLYDTNGSAVQNEKINHKGLNLEGVIANRAVGLSEVNIMLFAEKGEYYPFDENVIRGLFSNKPIEEINISEISSVDTGLTLFHVKIIDSYAQWSTLKKLDLTSNNIGEEGGEIIGNNKFWVHLEELVLRETNIGDRSAVAISQNHTWKNLKKLDLSNNKIGNKGAISIATNDVWKSLTVLNLSWNKIHNKGIAALVANKTWMLLKSLELQDNSLKVKDGTKLFPTPPS